MRTSSSRSCTLSPQAPHRTGAPSQWEALLATRNIAIQALLATTILAGPALAADVTPDRLLNADREPQNWLMNHRTYDGQRFSPLARINRDNVKNLKLAYAVPLGGGAGNEFIEATPLAEDGFLYITDSWGVLYKIDATLGRCRPHRLAHGPEAGAAGAPTAAPRCGAISSSPAPASFGRRASSPPTRKPARWCGRPTFSDTPRRDHHRGAARHQGQDHRRRRRRRQRRARLDRRRSMPRPASGCGANTPFRRPANPAARPGRATPMPGRPAAAPSG